MQDENPSATGGEHILTPPPPVGSNSSGVRTLKFFTPARPTCCGWGPPALSGGGARTVPVRSGSAERETVVHSNRRVRAHGAADAERPRAGGKAGRCAIGRPTADY